MEKITLNDFLKLSKDNIKNKIFVFPTDTVYGVGCLYRDRVGLEKIYQMKKRDYGKPLPVLCSSVDMVKSISDVRPDVIPYTSKWPGALTIILFKPDLVDTIAVRIPDSPSALKIINHLGPLYTTSVNYSGEKELNDVNEIGEIFKDYIDYLIIDPVQLSKIPSTIINCLDKQMKVIRQGSIYF